MFPNLTDEVVEYKIGEFVYAPVPGKYLFLFKTLEDALNRVRGLICGTWNFALFKCEAVGVCEKPNTKFFREILVDIPDGTVYAYGVKLIEEVTFNKINPEIDFFHKKYVLNK